VLIRETEHIASNEHVDAPLVSVCVPTFNDGLFLRASLESIVRQSYSRLEILVGDDCSADETSEIVRSFQDDRIIYRRNATNLGQFRNVNALISRARGKYIAVYHSDDVYEPRIVQQEVAFLNGHPSAGAIFALDRRIDNAGRLLGETHLPPGIKANTCLGPGDVMPVLLRHKNRLLRAPTFMGRAEVFEQVGAFNAQDYDIAGDLEMWLRILTRYRIAILDEHLLWYRRSQSQLSTRYNVLRTVEEDFFPLMDRYLTTFEGMGVSAADLIEYAFHRCDDETFRSANLVVLGQAEPARELLRRPYPWRTLLVRSWWRRKVRVLLLRTVLRAGLALGATGLLSRLVIRMEYGGRSC
jgi:glycosyltransferase involved in cell wall biosynthesis